jgi:hypothetical protein
MNIKRLLQTSTLLFLLSPVHSYAVGHDRIVPVEFDHYFEAALRVYKATIPPSINTSELFYDFMEKKWQQKQCSGETECSRLGMRVASEFANNLKTREDDAKL